MAKRPDAVDVLIADHRTVNELFRRFEETGDRAVKARGSLVEAMVRELSIHAAIEEQLLYPRARLEGGELEEMVLEALEEHHVAKELLAELEKLAPDNERFAAKTEVLIESVRHHVKEEEGNFFPKVRRAIPTGELVELGEALEALKTMAPTRPHPHAPDEPPANLANLGVAGMDRVRDVAEQAVETTGRAVRKGAKAVGKSR